MHGLTEKQHIKCDVCVVTHCKEKCSDINSEVIQQKLCTKEQFSFFLVMTKTHVNISTNGYHSTCIQLDLPPVTNRRTYLILYFISQRSFLQLICQRDVLITEIFCIKVPLPNELLMTLILFREYLPEPLFQVFLLVESISRNNCQNHSYINPTSLKTMPKTIFTRELQNVSENPIILQY